MQVIAATPSERAELGAARDALERFVRGQVALAVVQRWALWDSLRRNLGAALQGLAGPELLAANAEQDQRARQLAMLVRGLDSGQLELAAWAEPLEHGRGPLRLAVVQAGTLGLFPILPVIVIAGAAAIAGGAFVLADAWTEARKLEAEATATRAKTAAQITARVTQLAATDPQGAAQLAGALTAANQAANAAQPSLLDRLTGAVRGVLPSSPDLGWIGWAALAWLLLRRRAT